MRDKLKEIIAIIRPEKWRATQQAVVAAGALGVSQNRVLGRGRQAGLRYPGVENGTVVMGYLPKRMLNCVVPADKVEAVVQGIIRANRTGNPGDGKIFVCPVSDAARVRTGERGESAISK